MPVVIGSVGTFAAVGGGILAIIAFLYNLIYGVGWYNTYVIIGAVIWIIGVIMTWSVHSTIKRMTRELS